MITSYFDWEQYRQSENVRETLSSMAGSSVQDAAELAQNERLKWQ
jgi:hypothetical protein